MRSLGTAMGQDQSKARKVQPGVNPKSPIRPQPPPAVRLSSNKKRSAFPSSGSLRFEGGPLRTPSKWVKLPHDCDEHAAVLQLMEVWGRQPPSGMISLIGPGGADSVVGLDLASDVTSLEEALHDYCDDFPVKEFQEGLTHALHQSGAWLITDGVCEGVGGLLGRPGPRSTHDHTACIGINSWDAIAGKEERRVFIPICLAI